MGARFRVAVIAHQTNRTYTNCDRMELILNLPPPVKIPIRTHQMLILCVQIREGGVNRQPQLKPQTPCTNFKLSNLCSKENCSLLKFSHQSEVTVGEFLHTVLEWRDCPRSFMWSVMVVAMQSVASHVPHLLQAVEDIEIQHHGAVGSV